MKVAIIYDRINKIGGAERLLQTIHNFFPEAPIFTLVHDKSGAQWAKEIKIVPTFLNMFSFLRRRHQLLAPIAPLAFESINLDKFDLVISVTSSDAKSVITKPNQTHICICLTPTRYLWKGSKNYTDNWKMRILPRWLLAYFKLVDLITSQRPDYYIAISKEVKKRIKKYYQRDSKVIYPPILDTFFNQKMVSKKSDFYLVAGRLVNYKRVDLVINCFNQLNKRLVIAGDGEEYYKLKKISSVNITFLGKVSDKKLINLYQQAKALIFPGEEDFGLVPVEAQSQGTPVIAYGKGGVKETVLDGKTGILFPKQTPMSLAKAIERFENSNLSSSDCINNAKRFTQKKFHRDFNKYLKTKIS